MGWRDIVATITGRRMTAGSITTTGNASVIKRTGTEGLIERVTEATILTRGDMRRGRVIYLACRKYTIMAGITALAIDLCGRVFK